ncbi:MAG: bifunctional pyr operon transcriptional regulator/uracil phosphoribosyltransferase PyrR [Saprospiraceae bacterium]|nr:bifunctional pyr operon transcriptional regulator/uracil phosphoribosyltransferase PyrR [Saprospiraceae bacterium]
MNEGRVILNQERFALTIERLCQQLIEEYDDFNATCLVGIQTGGAVLTDRLCQRIQEILGIPKLASGKLDITFYRDDFRRRDKPLAPSATEMDFIVEDKNVVLIDDVLYTGRTTQAALTALNHFGRPRSVELLVMVDRRFNRHLPVQPDFVGIVIDALDEAYVRVEWQEENGEDRILLFADK